MYQQIQIWPGAGAGWRYMWISRIKIYFLGSDFFIFSSLSADLSHRRVHCSSLRHGAITERYEYILRARLEHARIKQVPNPAFTHLPPEEPNPAKSCNKKEYRKKTLLKRIF
jgi:hypothetical protein